MKPQTVEVVLTRPDTTGRTALRNALTSVAPLTLGHPAGPGTSLDPRWATNR